jgi:hypothetical protein
MSMKETPAAAPEAEAPKPPETVLGYPVRYRLTDAPTSPKLILAGHREPQKLTLYVSWFVLKHFADQFVAGLATIDRTPEGILVMSFGAMKIPENQSISFDDRLGAAGILGPDGKPLGGA